MKCTKCGNDNLPGAKFCTGCGATLTTASPSATATSMGMGGAGSTGIQPGVAPLAVATAGAALERAARRLRAHAARRPSIEHYAGQHATSRRRRPLRDRNVGFRSPRVPHDLVPNPNVAFIALHDIADRATCPNAASPTPPACRPPAALIARPCTCAEPGRPAHRTRRAPVADLRGRLVPVPDIMGGLKEPSTGAVPAPPSSHGQSTRACSRCAVQGRTRAGNGNSPAAASTRPFHRRRTEQAFRDRSSDPARGREGHRGACAKSAAARREAAKSAAAAAKPPRRRPRRRRRRRPAAAQPAPGPGARPAAPAATPAPREAPRWIGGSR